MIIIVNMSNVYFIIINFISFYQIKQKYYHFKFLSLIIIIIIHKFLKFRYINSFWPFKLIQITVASIIKILDKPVIHINQIFYQLEFSQKTQIILKVLHGSI
jgi:hypothetical protein